MTTESETEAWENEVFLLNTESPDCWDNKQVKYFTKEYPWMFFNNKKIGGKICSKANFNLTKHQGTQGNPPPLATALMYTMYYVCRPM